MRIGLLTLPLHTNYGGILQAYALQTVLERMGHEVCLIEKRRKQATWKMPYLYGKRILMNLKGIKTPIFYEQIKKRESSIISQNTDKFITKYIKRQLVNKYTELDKNDFDIIIVGSDQVWRFKYWGRTEIKNAYLAFTKGWNIKRIAYAASFGTDKWESSKLQTLILRKLAMQFNVISVREMSGIELCQRYLKVEATQVLDPTMLLDTDDYIQLFKNTDTPQSNGTLLSYILDAGNEKEAIINKIANDLHLLPFHVNSKIEDATAPLEKRIQPSVEQWLRGFYDAKFVITDSFHACVFSILFKKPFIVYGNVERGLARFTSLLKVFGLENRLITSINDWNNNFSDINWDKVYAQLDLHRARSKDFLTASLKAKHISQFI